MSVEIKTRNQAFKVKMQKDVQREEKESTVDEIMQESKEKNLVMPSTTYGLI